MCDICEYRKSHLHFVVEEVDQVEAAQLREMGLGYPFIDEEVRAGAFIITVCPDEFDGEYVGDSDAIYPILGSRRVGLYMPDTLLKPEAEMVAEELRKRGYAVRVAPRGRSGWMCGAEEADVVYALDSAYLGVFDDGRATHQVKGLLLGYSLEQVLAHYPNE